MVCRQVRLDADVLVLGGGLAGCMAAIRAAEMGLDTLVLEKANVERSGCAATGLDHYWTLPPDKGVSVEDFIRQYAKNVEYLVDQEVLRTIVTESFQRARDLEAFGIQMRVLDGEYRWVSEPFIFPYNFSIHYAGRDIKAKLAQEARRRGARVLNRVMATRLLTEGNRVVGATGVGVRDGTFYTVRSKATVLATGGATRLYRTPSGRAFSTFACPSDTGDGFAAAFHAGAELTNMEFSEGTAAPKSFRPGSIGNFTGVGGKLVNVKGEPFSRTHLRFLFAANFMREVQNGNGPLFVDTSFIRKEDWRWVEMGLGNEVPMFLKYLKEAGVIGGDKKVAVEITEYDLRDGRSGVVIDKDGRASLEGLYAAGDVMGGVAEAGGPGAITMGWKAGETAAGFARDVGFGNIDEAQVSNELARVEAPLRRDEGLTWPEAQAVLQQIMTEQVGPVRAESSLRWALKKIEELSAEAERSMRAADYHEWYRCLEVFNLLDVARMCVVASLSRRESRHLPYFQRQEFPERNDAEWLRFVIVRKGQDGKSIDVTTRPIPMLYRE